ncbi:MAG: DUF885 family protein [Gemmatimonadales bacterium]|nr:MAG: DUF885 family protein [Gemmatimonadales bacterium]
MPIRTGSSRSFGVGVHLPLTLLFSFALAAGAVALVPALLEAQPVAEYTDPQTSDMREVVERFSSDRAVLGRFYSVSSPRQRDRMRAFYTEWGERLDAMDYDALNHEGKIDWVLLRNRVRYDADRLEVEAGLATQLQPILPFRDELAELHESRRDLEGVEDPRAAADLLARVTDQIEDTRAAVREALQNDRVLEGGTVLTPVVALRAVERANELRQSTQGWFNFFDGYDPLFSWWVRAPYEAFDEAIQGYITFLRQEGAGIRPGQEEPIIGDPLGRDALVLDLRNEMIAYSPEELLELAEYELEWGTERLKEASREMGFGDDWHAALEHVKGLHVEPGEQIHLVTEMAREAEAFLEERDLVTVPPLAREIWRMEMLSPQQQRVAPFFLGGEVVRVAFPTDGMAHEDKVMSLRANNEHFSRAVVHHELIPGHHLQGFYTSRYSTHRSLFSTPFWGEGWALYWELLLWDLDFARGPEDEIGMLVWRNHRAARILFSLAFHMELMTPEEAIELLVERVGFERAASEAEVRRSFTGQYSPLYQAGYLLGGLQIRELHRELVESGQMTNRDFHDHILKSGRMPIEMVRASVTGESPPRDFEARWRFHPEIP